MMLLFLLSVFLTTLQFPTFSSVGGQLQQLAHSAMLIRQDIV